MLNENTFNIVTALSKTIRLMSKVFVQVEIKDENRWILASSDLPINRIVNVDAVRKSPLLPLIMRNFIIYGEVYLYKIPTNRSMLNPSDSLDYKDGSLYGLTVLDNINIRGKEDRPINEKQTLVTMHGILEPKDYAYIKQYSPYYSFGVTSIFGMINEHFDKYSYESGYAYGDISGMTGIPHELIDDKATLDEDRKRALIRRVVEDVVMPKAELFTAAIDKQIGLDDNTHLIHRIDSDLDWIKAWEGE